MEIIAEITKKEYTITIKEGDEIVAEVKMLKIRGGARGANPAAEYEGIINELGLNDVFEKIDSTCFDAMCKLNREEQAHE